MVLECARWEAGHVFLEIEDASICVIAGVVCGVREQPEALRSMHLKEHTIHGFVQEAVAVDEVHSARDQVYVYITLHRHISRIALRRWPQILCINKVGIPSDKNVTVQA